MRSDSPGRIASLRSREIDLRFATPRDTDLEIDHMSALLASQPLALGIEGNTHLFWFATRRHRPISSPPSLLILQE